MGLTLSTKYRNVVLSILRKEEYVGDGVVDEPSDDYQKFSFLCFFVKNAKELLPNLKLALMGLSNVEMRCEEIFPKVESSFILRAVLEKKNIDREFSISIWLLSKQTSKKAKDSMKDYMQVDKDLDALLDIYDSIIDKFFPFMRASSMRLGSA